MNEGMKTTDASEPLHTTAAATIAIDPVCGMTVTAQRAAGSYEYEGVTYYFCSTGCLNKFKANPQAYLNQPPQPMAHQHASQPVQLAGKANSLPVMTQPPTVQAAHNDPVCGMQVNPSTAAGSHEYDGTTYYFCSTHCLNKFKTDPQSFLHPSPKPQTSAPAGAKYVCPMDADVVSDKPGACPKCGMALEPTLPAAPLTKIEYTCPMHPEIVRDEPGSCPICGMALEARTVTLEAAANPELTDMTRRFWWSAALSLPVFLLAMSEMIPEQPVQHWLSPRLINWIQFLLATPVVLWGGWPFFQRGWASIVNRSPNMFTLIAIGTGAAYSFSVFAHFFPGVFPASFRGHGGEVAVYFEAAAVIVVVVVGRWLHMPSILIMTPVMFGCPLMLPVTWLVQATFNVLGVRIYGAGQSQKLGS